MTNWKSPKCLLLGKELLLTVSVSEVCLKTWKTIAFTMLGFKKQKLCICVHTHTHTYIIQLELHKNNT